ncbi:hypothetical protein RR11_3232 [Ruegeria sp. R11]|nr:hypothetical protein RR11_3232 [Ruegeria sp. R11]
MKSGQAARKWAAYLFQSREIARLVLAPALRERHTETATSKTGDGIGHWHFDPFARAGQLT